MIRSSVILQKSLYLRNSKHRILYVGNFKLFGRKHKGCKNDCENINSRKRFLVLDESFENVLICIMSIGPSGTFRSITNFPNFCQNKNSLELLNIIFENSSSKGSLGPNK